MLPVPQNVPRNIPEGGIATRLCENSRRSASLAVEPFGIVLAYTVKARQVVLTFNVVWLTVWVDR